MQNLIVLIIIILAALFIGRRLVKALRSGKTPSCCNGCSGCGSASSRPSVPKTSS
ncbi:MAG TPA: FeoB-associated Cys-rich membrane protein [Desulfobulbaceae bacterium]|nr:FeoB-associated Cys-rich membrane protein [Desulfobulbaceae bacterium]